MKNLKQEVRKQFGTYIKAFRDLRLKISLIGHQCIFLTSINLSTQDAQNTHFYNTPNISLNERLKIGNGKKINRIRIYFVRQTWSGCTRMLDAYEISDKIKITCTAKRLFARRTGTPWFIQQATLKLLQHLLPPMK